MQRNTHEYGSFPRLALIGTALSFLSCYGVLAFVAILSLAGITLSLDENIWAAAIVGFALLAVFGITIGYLYHRNFGPIALAVFGSLLIISAMYASGQIHEWFGLSARFTETLGFALLLSAAVWDWRKRKHV